MKNLLLALAMMSYGLAFGQKKNINIVPTDAGKVSGFMDSTQSVHIYKGIPYAAPPVGNLRWKEPQPSAHWQGVKACTQFSASPMQGSPDEFGVYTREFLVPHEPLSEDCLYLNVWTGAHTNTEKRPVLVWIYGGGFNAGGAAVPIYDGVAMAGKGIIFVSFNYRLGIFGFFAHPELTKESAHHASGNYGLLDQLAALRWVQKNIAAFGGDPNNVTIAGQSAGGWSVNSLVASPLSKGLFKHAIAESGAMMVDGLHGVTTLQQAEASGEKLAQKLGAHSITDLRNMTAAQLVGKASAHVITDGYVLPEPVSQIFAKGKQNNVPVLTGWNGDDAFVGPPKNAVDYKKQIEQQYGAQAAEVLKLYPANTDLEADVSQTRINRDAHFGIQNYTWANVQSSQGKAPVYLYRFNRKLRAAPAFTHYGAFHTAEVAYALDNLKFLHRPWQAADLKLATLMSDYWLNFIRTGNPNGKGLPEWPDYNTHSSEVMILDIKSGAEPLPDKAALEFALKQAAKE